MSSAYCQDRPVSDKPALPVTQAMNSLAEVVSQLESTLHNHRDRLSPVLNHAVTEGNNCEKGEVRPADPRLSASIEHLAKRVAAVTDGIRNLDDRLEI